MAATTTQTPIDAENYTAMRRGFGRLLSLIGGLDRPNEGRVVIDGQPIWELEEAQLVVFRRHRR